MDIQNALKIVCVLLLLGTVPCEGNSVREWAQGSSSLLRPCGFSIHLFCPSPRKKFEISHWRWETLDFFWRASVFALCLFEVCDEARQRVLPREELTPYYCEVNFFIPCSETHFLRF